MISDEDRELLTKLLLSKEFTEKAEKELGPIINIAIYDDEIHVLCEKGKNVLNVDVTLATLRGQFH